MMDSSTPAQAGRCCARLKVPALLALATLACYPQLVVEPGGVLYGTFHPPGAGYSDFAMLFPKPFEVMRESLWTEGEWARWNRLTLGGPLVGHPQAALFYPPNWIMLLVPPLGIKFRHAAHSK